MSITKWKKRCPILFALALTICVAGYSAVTAVGGIDFSEEASLTLEIAEESEYANDLSGISLHAEVYLAATANANSSYTAQAGFEDIDFTALLVGDADWDEAAETAEGYAAEADACGEITLTDGSGSLSGMTAGIYLVIVDDAETELYTYSAQTFFIAVPGEQDGSWQYDVTATLKLERSPRYGSIRIVKTLSSYNSSLGDVTCVFPVEGTDASGNTVYSDVVSLTHSAAGTKEVLIEGIPAGTTVTVTEVYSGASYELQTETEQTAVIAADEIVEVSFENAYDEKLVPGYGVTNHFDYDEDEGWLWSQQTDNSTQSE